MPEITECPNGPYRCTNVLIKITAMYNGALQTVVVGVAEGLDIDLSYAGGPEPHYGSRTKKHSAGSKSATFTITRWFYTDAGQEDLLLDLFTGEVEFELEGSLIDNNNVAIPNTSIKLICCRLYRWRPRTGGADDVVGEEASGSALDWEITVLPTCCCENGEAIRNGTFEEADADLGATVPAYWTVVGGATRSNVDKCTGTWSAEFTENVVDKIYQDLTCYGVTDEWAIDTDYITAFTLNAMLEAGATAGDLKVKLYYTDNTTEIVTFAGVNVGSCTSYDVLPELDAGKCLWRVEVWFENIAAVGKKAYVDDVSITMADCP